MSNIIYNALFPTYQVVSDITSSFLIQQNVKPFLFPQQSFLQNRTQYICIDQNGVQIQQTELQQAGSKYQIYIPQSYILIGIHQGILLSTSTTNASKSYQSTAQLLSDSNIIQKPTILGVVVQDINGVQYYIKGTTGTQSIYSDLLNVYQPNKNDPGSYLFGNLQSNQSFNTQSIVNKNGSYQLSQTSSTIAGVHSIIMNDVYQCSMTFMKSSTNMLFMSFNGIVPIQIGCALIGIVQQQSGNYIFIYGYQYDVQVYGADSTTNNAILTYQQSLNNSYVNTVMNDIILMTSDYFTILIPNAKQQQNAINLIDALLTGYTLICGQSLQGKMDTQMLTLCNSPTWGNQPICSCYNKSILPCLSGTCQQKGYKTATLLATNCQQQLQGVQLNYQDCSTYQAIQAGGNISIDNSVMSSCQQIINDAAPTAKSSTSTNTNNSTTQQGLTVQTKTQWYMWLIYALCGIVLIASIFGIYTWIKKNKSEVSSALKSDNSDNSSNSSQYIDSKQYALQSLNI